MAEEMINMVEEEEEDVGTYHHVFTKPFNYNGNVYASLDFDFTKLTGRDMNNAISELKAKRVIVTVPDLDVNYQLALAARACSEKIGTDAFDYMPLKDCGRIKAAMQAFLLA